MYISNEILKIKSQYNTFNATEKKIAEYIINNNESIIYCTISQIADKLQVSDATIFRFCKKINLKGFQELKITLATEMNKNSNDNKSYKEIDDNDEGAIITKVFNTNIAALHETLASIDINAVKEACNTILAADQIVFYGNGGSGAVAIDAQQKFLRTGLKVSVYTDSHLQLMSIAQLTKRDVAIVISHSGVNLDIIHLLKIAKKNGTKTIAITSYQKTPVNELADISLNIISQETGHEFEAFASRIAHLTIIDALYMNVILKRKDLTNKAIQKMRNAVSYTKM